MYPAVVLKLITFVIVTAVTGGHLGSEVQNRVGGINSNVEVLTGASPATSSGGHWGIYDGEPRLAVDALLAAKVGGETSQILLRTPKQLQAKFKHASDFGVTGNYSKAKASEFSSAIHQHINSPGVRAIQGTYHKNPVTHYLDPSTGLNVMADPAGNFISGWRLSPGQLQNVLTHGGL